MTIYEDYSQSPDGWNVTSTLRLEDDGRFSYEERWTDYTNASLYGGAEGRWRRDSGVVVFLAESVEGSMYHPWAAGQELKAVERGATLDFGGGCTLRIPPEREVNIPVRNTGFKPLTVVLEPWGIRHTVAPGEAGESRRARPLGAGRARDRQGRRRVRVLRLGRVAGRGRPGAEATGGGRPDAGTQRRSGSSDRQAAGRPSRSRRLSTIRSTRGSSRARPRLSWPRASGSGLTRCPRRHAVLAPAGVQGAQRPAAPRHDDIPLGAAARRRCPLHRS